MASRKPKKDEAPTCEKQDCHSAKMDVQFKVGDHWFWKCSKCGYVCTASSVTVVPQALKEYMRAGRPKKEAPK